MNLDPKNDDAYLDLRPQKHADKSFMGTTRLSTRTALFFFVGVLAMVAFAAMYFHTDQRLSIALGSWKNAQRVAGAVTELGRAIDDVRVFDARVRETGDPVASQGHRRAGDRVAVALDVLQRIPQADLIRDPIITTRDAFADYSAEFIAMTDFRIKLGMDENTGLNGQRRDIATKIREVMKANELGDLVGDFDALDASSDEDPAPVDGDARNAVGMAYKEISQRLEQSAADDEVKRAITQLLQRHAGVVAAILDIKARSVTDAPPFTEILDYIGPSLRDITDFSEQFGRAAPAAFEREHQQVRQIVVIGSIAILGVLILFGIVMLRSITSPLRRLTEVVRQLADGDRAISIPLRGNQDSIGDMARALDTWLDHMAEADHLRVELDDVRMRLALGAIAEAVGHPEMDDITTGQSSDKRDDNDDADATTAPDDVPPLPAPPFVDQQPPTMPTLPPEPMVQQPPSLPPLSSPGQIGSPIGNASKQLSEFSEFVTDAARDVERTEMLIQALSDTTRHVSELEGCVAMIRDEANLLVFRTPNRTAPNPVYRDDETLVYLPGGEPHAPQEGRRFDAIRQTVNRAERLIVAARGSLDMVNVVAQEIASTASTQALAATNKLLSQSEYLQNMLDDLVHKLGPASRAEGTPSLRPDKKGDSEV